MQGNSENNAEGLSSRKGGLWPLIISLCAVTLILLFGLGLYFSRNTSSIVDLQIYPAITSRDATQMILRSTDNENVVLLLTDFSLPPSFTALAGSDDVYTVSLSTQNQNILVYIPKESGGISIFDQEKRVIYLPASEGEIDAFMQAIQNGVPQYGVREAFFKSLFEQKFVSEQEVEEINQYFNR